MRIRIQHIDMLSSCLVAAAAFVILALFTGPLARKIRGVFRFLYRHKSPRVVQVQC